MIQFNLDTAEAPSAASPFSVSVIGIGGSGTNVIDKIALEGMPGADLVSLNCDARALNTSMANTKVQLGKSLTQGLGCGGDPELGAEAATASSDDIRALLTGRNMVFLCVGLGGGTGSGAAPVVARMAREAGAFVVVFATLPFAFEGRRRSNQASVALQDLRKYANALVTFENDRMGELVVPKKGVQEAFELADKIIGQSVRAVTSLVTQPGLIHIGMDDLVTALRNTDSRCLFGYGQAKGENRAVEALGLALKSPLLDRGQMLTGARNVLVHICGGTTLTLFEIETLMRELGKHVHEDAQILFGAATDGRLAESLSVTILTSLTKPGTVTEIQAEPAAVAPPQAAPAAVIASPVAAAPAAAPAPAPVQAVVETVVPQAIAPAPVAAPAAAPAPAPVVEMIAPAPAPVVAAPVPAPVAERVLPLIEDAELFPEIVPTPAPVAETMMIEIPAVKPVAPAPAPVRPAPAPPVAEVAPEEEYYEESMEEEPIADESWHPAPDETYIPVAAAAPVAEEPVSEPVYYEEEEEIEAIAPPPVPERIIRIERLPVTPARPAPVLPEPAPVARQEPTPAPAPRKEAAPVSRKETAPPPKRFALTDIIKPKAAPPQAPPVVEYSAPEEEEEIVPVRPAPAPAPVSRRTPDFDRVTPIRPIPAGRSTTPAPSQPAASPFTQTKAPSRAVPTQQQTFDERLQPASTGSRFERTKPTVEEGEDLDVPTFLRRKR